MKALARPSLAFAIVNDVLLIAHGTDAPDDETWDKLITLSIDHYRRVQYTRALATSAGGAPTTAQRYHFDRRIRAELIAKYGSPRGRMAVLSDSGFTRAVVSASAMLSENWFSRAIRGGGPPQLYRAFRLDEAKDAIAWLEATPGKEDLLIRELERLRQEVAQR